MHNDSLRIMSFFRDNFLQDMKGATILDVGARVGKKRQSPYRTLFTDYKYTGMDIIRGHNVDIVGFDAIKDVYDVVISGQTMEHVKRPWDWLKNLTNYFSNYICIIAPHTWEEHPYPIDTYRYMPDGMRDLFEYAGIKEVLIKKYERDTLGVGCK